MFSGSSADTAKKLSVLVGTDVTLSCLSRPEEWSTLTVEWNMVDKHAGKSIVYTFEDGRAHVSRGKFAVNRMGLPQSDASLQLRNVTVGDEGLYTCRIITPVVYTQSTSLEVQGIDLFVSTGICVTSVWIYLIVVFPFVLSHFRCISDF